MKLLVTGGAGFIGSNFIHHILSSSDDTEIVNMDALTYAGNLENLASLKNHTRYCFEKGDITDPQHVDHVFKQHKPEAVVHFAAESHVDRSLHLGPEQFIYTNILGTQRLLDASRRYSAKRFVHVSTDEVYGSLGAEGRFSEISPIQPNNPYAASKAASDFMVRAASHSHGMDAVITRCSNNFGPYQFPEKLIPLMISNALEDRPLPVYGDGMQVRDWIYVQDHCRGVELALRHGKSGEIYNIGGVHEVPNIEVVRALLQILKKPDSLIRFVKDRPGHDRRYAIDSSKIRRELGWHPAFEFDKALEMTVAWYLANRPWWERIRSGEYRAYYDVMYGER